MGSRTVIVSIPTSEQIYPQSSTGKEHSFDLYPTTEEYITQLHISGYSVQITPSTLQPGGCYFQNSYYAVPQNGDQEILFGTRQREVEHKATQKTVSFYDSTISISNPYNLLCCDAKVNILATSASNTQSVTIYNPVFYVFTLATAKTLTINQSAHGTATAKRKDNTQTTKSFDVIYQDDVILSAVTDAHYVLSGWDSEQVTVTDNQFNMPDSAVTVTPVYTYIGKNVSFVTVEHGYGIADKPIADPGETVTLTPMPNAHYRFLRWETSPEVVITNNTFVMPDYDVAITPVFVEKDAGYYNGSSYLPCVPMYYDGTNWIECGWKYYDGTNWNDGGST